MVTSVTTMEKGRDNPIKQLICCVVKGYPHETDDRCKAAFSELEVIKSHINLDLKNKKALDDIEQLIDCVKKNDFKAAQERIKLANDAFINCVIPHYERENSRLNESGSSGWADQKENKGHSSELSGQTEKVRPNEVPCGTDVTKPRENLQELAARFQNIFDGIWLDAHEKIEEQLKGASKKRIAELLFEIVQRAATFCNKEMDDQFKEAEKCAHHVVRTGKFPDKAAHGSDTSKTPVDLLKSYICLHANLAVPRLKQNFRKQHMVQIYKKYLNSKQYQQLDQYADSCVEVTWLLCTEDPPVQLVLNATDLFDDKMYKVCTQKGNKIDYIVWPALIQPGTGHVIAKGLVECKK